MSKDYHIADGYGTHAEQAGKELPTEKLRFIDIMESEKKEGSYGYNDSDTEFAPVENIGHDSSNVDISAHNAAFLAKKSAERFALTDSGEREKFEGGAVRDIREGKGRYDLFTPLGLARVAAVYEKGAVKYAERNWEKGMPPERCLDSAMRHILSHMTMLLWKRQGLTPETLPKGIDPGEDHLAQAAWNLMAVMHFEDLPPAKNPLEDSVDEIPEIKSEDRRAQTGTYKFRHVEVDNVMESTAKALGYTPDTYVALDISSPNVEVQPAGLLSEEELRAAAKVEMSRGMQNMYPAEAVAPEEEPEPKKKNWFQRWLDFAVGPTESGGI